MMINFIRRNLNQILTVLFSILVVLITIYVGLIIANRLNRKYVYVDMYGSTGKSTKCYYDENAKDLRCMIPVKVQQYSREK